MQIFGEVMSDTVAGRRVLRKATSKNPEIEWVEKLSIVWTRRTQEWILRNREAEGPWLRGSEWRRSMVSRVLDVLPAGG